MTDTLPPAESLSDDAMVVRLLEAAREQNRRIHPPSLHVARTELADRLAAILKQPHPSTSRTGMRAGTGSSRSGSHTAGRFALWTSVAAIGKNETAKSYLRLFGAMTGAAIVIAAATWFGGTLRSGGRSSTPMSIYTTANGRWATVTLPDGNTVSLNVASQLKVPADYLRGNRTLYLQGEALFTVTHHADQPVTVIAGPGTARVLGTSFVVRHYATDIAATVVVRDGKVAVGSTVLTARQQLEIGTAGVSPVRPANLSRFSFATGSLMLDGLSLPEAIIELNRWYDADIRLGDAALRTQHIKGRFMAGSLSDLTTILEWMLNVRVVREGRVLTLEPK